MRTIYEVMQGQGTEEERDLALKLSRLRILEEKVQRYNNNRYDLQKIKTGIRAGLKAAALMGMDDVCEIVINYRGYVGKSILEHSNRR